MPQETPSARRRQIVDTAIELFGKWGFTGTSVDQIAAAVGMKKGSLYYHFESKQEILDAIHAEVLEALFTQAGFAAGVITQAGLDPCEQLRQVIENHVEYQWRNVRYLVVYDRERHLLPASARRKAHEQETEYTEAVVEILRRCQESGCVDATLDLEVLTYALFGALTTLRRWKKARLASRARRHEIATNLHALFTIDHVHPQSPG
ncbi:hypothetical protein AU252_00915 [Pseudarthrobacter sulfonivorans]|uniref:HTH tetR-type domain-containing protein n=2 Tax=Pseudarthrobacter sulfonivorans TaxID=121292 RepID=A0A0U3QSN9_9MICC|nr:hypothetical protein AU252_00915 [Pseudarthrobacter sulfonivorans]